MMLAAATGQREWNKASQDTPTQWAWREEDNDEIEGGKLQDILSVICDPQWSCKVVTSANNNVVKITEENLPNISQ